MSLRRRFIDIGANLVDEMYQGFYNGKKYHDCDLDNVLQRAWKIGVEKIFITAGNLEDSDNAVKIAKSDDRLFSTIGVHPTRCLEFTTKFPDPSLYMEKLKSIYNENPGKIIALGELGLDYDRTNFCDIENQKKFFQLQLEELGNAMNLPLFLHCRGAASDLQEILNANKKNIPKSGVIHSFDGTVEEMNEFVKMGYYIGINGCSLKTEKNCKVVSKIPMDKLILETDAPWCGIRPSHFSSKLIKTKFETSKKKWDSNQMYKTRNEPQAIVNVLEVIAGLKCVDELELCDQIFENTTKLFF